jgi:hypothetical protein
MYQYLASKAPNISQQIEKSGKKKSKQNKFPTNPLERVRDCLTNGSAIIRIFDVMQ